MTDNKIFIFDFDSTFIQVETLDILAEICANSADNAKAIKKRISELTEDAMNGKMPYQESLQERLDCLKITNDSIQQAIQVLKNNISPSFLKHKRFFHTYADQIYVISGSFSEIIWPIVSEFGIKQSHVFGNRFLYDFEGNVKGYDRFHPLAQDQGKVKCVHQLGLKGEIIVIGDGYNDYEIRAAELANTFIAYTENVTRDSVVQMADAVIDSLDGLFITCALPINTTTQNAKKVLLLENIHPSVTHFYESHGYTVENIPNALDEASLIQKLSGVEALGIRSKTVLTDKVLKAATHLQVIGAFCIGTNQIDLGACSKQGIAVFNAPYSNTRSVVELALAEMIFLARNIQPLSEKLKLGQWQKSAQGAHEIRGKTLGIVGYGHIGSQLSVLAEALGMQVIFYDIVDKLALGNAKPTPSLQALLKQADIVSIHIDGRPENQGVINREAFAAMKNGVIFLNLSRDSVLDQDALLEALTSKKVAGAALDVFPEEPLGSKATFHTPFAAFDNVILTPHIGGSTQEAQEHIGHYVANHLNDYLTTGNTVGSVNFPALMMPPAPFAQRVIHIHENVPGMLAKINAYFAQLDINITGQLLKTQDQIGVVITELNKALSENDLAALQAIPHTIRVRSITNS